MDQPDLILKPLAEDSATKVLPPLTAAEAGFGRMSQEAGFPPETQQPLETGGKAPQRDDMNGALNLLSQHLVFQQAGGQYKFNPVLTYDIGHRIVLDDGVTEVMSIVDGNNSDPNAGLGSSWRSIVVVPPATETVAGVIRIATDDEVYAGAVDDAAVTPLKLKNKSQASKTDDTPGKLLMTGAHGMGGGGIFLPEGVDLNDVMAYGIYRVTLGLNIPAGFEHSTMLVMVGGTDVVTQLMISNQSGIIATRALIIGGSGWGLWNIQWGNANLDLNAIVSIPVGVPIAWPTEIPPPRFLLMQGQPFDVSSFPGLATVYPSGVVPDMRGEWIRGADTYRGIDPGRALLSWQPGMIEAHDHVAAVGAGQNILGGGGVPAPTVGSTSTSVTGGSETRPRNVAFNFICRAH
jgi:hypothetical protein